MRSVVLIFLIIIGFADLIVLNVVAIPRLGQEEQSNASISNRAAGSESWDYRNGRVGSREESQVHFPGESSFLDSGFVVPDDSRAVSSLDILVKPDASVALGQEPSSGTFTRREERLARIAFDSGSAEIDAPSRVLLEQIAQEILARAELPVAIKGHTDKEGLSAMNLDLSRARAETVAAFLASRGIDSARFEIEWFGENQPFDDRDLPEAREQNRRVEIYWRSR